ncbi:hypothetical protein KY385_00875 [Candidatus Parcubacteria bacterium]|nr:hypothetical protein [Candidatus Parcubacteria bacterium]
MSEDQFTKLFKYLQEEFKAVRSEIGEVKRLHLETQATLDSFAKQLLDITQEHMMLARKVDRMEDWIQKIAQKTGVKLDY